MEELLQMRKELDVLDEKLLTLFEKRLEICDRVGAIKAREGLPVLDEKREHEKLLAIESMVSEEKNEASVSELFEKIIEICRNRQYGA